MRSNLLRLTSVLVLSALAVLPSLQGQSYYTTPYSITTLAGTPTLNGSNDGMGSAAQFFQPTGVAVDSAGNVFVADTNNCSIRKVTPSGVVTTFAGLAKVSGTADGVGSSARFQLPQDLTIDTAGNLYVVDLNGTIRKITPDAVVTTLAGMANASGSGNGDGTGTAARFHLPSGVAVDAAGNVYVADTFGQIIRKVTPAGVVTTLAGLFHSSGSTDGTGNTARFSLPYGIAVDAAGSNIYVADTSNRTIRKISSGGVVTTLAGLAGSIGVADGAGSAARFGSPRSLTVDASGNLYVADTSNQVIRQVTPDGVVTTFVGSAPNFGSTDGIGSAARFYNPAGVTLDASGNLFVADTNNNTIRAVTAGGAVTTLAGSAPNWGADGAAGAAGFNRPNSVAVDSAGNAYVADTSNHTIRKVTSTGVVTTLAGSYGSLGSADGTGSDARFNAPAAVTVDSAGNVYVADGNCTVRKITAAGVVTTLAGSPGLIGSSDGTGSTARFFYPAGIAVDPAGTVYVADTGNSTIRKVTSSGVVSTYAGLAGSVGSANGTGSTARFNGPAGIALDSMGTLYVADPGGRTIRKITSAGAVTTVAGISGFAPTPGVDGSGTVTFGYPTGVAVDVTGNLYVADSGYSTIRRITPDGTVSTVAGLTNATGATDGTGDAARFARPHSVAVDHAGNIYVADTDNNTLRRGTPTLGDPAYIFTTAAGMPGVDPGSTDGAGSDARFNSPVGVAVDHAGNTYVADTNNSTIRKITISGVVSTLAGQTGIIGSADGEGGMARFEYPRGLVLDSAGNVYVTSSSAIRKITPAGVVSTFAGVAGSAGSTDGTGAAARFYGPTGIAIDHSGNLFVADAGNNMIRQISSAGVVTTFAGIAGGGSGAVDGTGAAARFNSPRGLAVDEAGNVYVADTDNHTIRKITIGGVVTTFAGSATNSGAVDGAGEAARFFRPEGVAVDAAGNVYVADTDNRTVRKITAAGVVTTLAGTVGSPGTTNGNGNSTLFHTPRGIAVDASGNNLYVADTGNNTIRHGVRATRSISDLNADGKSDLLLVNTSTGERGIWLMNGTGISTAVTLGIVTLDWTFSGTGDFDGDGKSDIFLTNTTTGERGIWLMNGPTIATATSLGVVPTDWSVSCVGDFNGDGKSDIFLTNTTTGERGIWFMNGTTVATAASLGFLPTTWGISTTGDLNGDGQSDILFTNTGTGERAIWLMNGASVSAGTSLGVLPLNWTFSGIGDFNGDGKADIFLTNTATGEWGIWLMNGLAIQSAASFGVLSTDWTVSAVADFNGDGKADLFLTNTATGERGIWLMNGTTVAAAASLGLLPTNWVIQK